jgi:methyltransferase family protein
MQPELDPDPEWVEVLSGRGPDASRGAIDEARGERRLFAHLQREHDREGRESFVEIDAPLELHALVRLLRPRHIVEVGVSSGVSSAYLLNALEKNGVGTLHSVDLPSFARPAAPSTRPPRSSWSLPTGRASGWAVPFALRKRWDLRLGDKAVVLPLLARELPRIDLVVYDVPHNDTTTRAEFRTLDPLARPGAVVIADHGPGGGRCGALLGWGRARGARPVRRHDLGLYGIRLKGRSNAAGPRRSARTARPRSG